MTRNPTCPGCGGTLGHLSLYEQRYHTYRCNNPSYSIVSNEAVYFCLAGAALTVALHRICQMEVITSFGVSLMILSAMGFWVKRVSRKG
ncbi:MAG TPA: hypothetical protein VL175_04670 [Pirellulales bacterium]|jgi:hypothetical protein|nr:hypothetical protein [Pirellulales bacterium]